jgi:CRP/FNR family cyclic AMP-dependent transcriptional regulator
MEWELLRGLREEQVAEVLAEGRRRRFAKREVVWHEGDRAEAIHMIRSGRIAIRLLTSIGDVATVSVMGPGQVAGLVEVHKTNPYHGASALALEPTETVAIRVEALSRARRRFPSVDDAIVRFLADRTIELAVQVVEARFVPADSRVLKRLVALCEVYGSHDGEVVIPLTQEDLAGVAGVARPTVNRVLREEERRGTIRLSRGKIIVADMAQLAARAE